MTPPHLPADPEPYPAPLDPLTAPVPPYGGGTLADLLPAVLAGLGVPVSNGDGPAPSFALPPADRACVFLVDGLGWEQLRAHPEDAPFLTSLLPSSLAGSGAPLVTGFPSTTATSLASVGTGLPPGRHGLVGYRVAIPGENRLMNQLRWRPHQDPRAWQPYPTLFRRAAAAGIETCQVSQPEFADTPLTRVALSGGSFHGRFTGEERMDLAAERLAAGDRSLVYAYYSDLDGTGHRLGVDSDSWRAQLHTVDRLARRLAESLPPRSVLYITGDHGMVDIGPDPEDRIDFDEDWELRAGVALLGGEGRARHVYAVPGGERDVLAVWSEVLGDRFWVASRQQAVAAGWFGPQVDKRVLGRIGDVIAAARDAVAVVASVTEPNETAMVGMHGSLAPSDRLVPLLEVRT
ncbi:alkaline phosphatase family protein [Mangrovactinospora gilvigrisea]|uniref:Alkaline phosphatase family protein n=1 Tax=Mangrovactinospora gilvigrisea TaxID=1428644 RepID=A0A1J7C3R6_9ACTN|nr:nucleotide pyrophosphatase/phosphodiesterase family protein [Mangrovactinospora gilvigrisea]OIV36204.1 alkaline phosphatase family protein [Mangrovactinospora gilvigrisea]